MKINYLISTFAPAASTFFLISSASCLVTPSLIVLGAPSTKAFASAKPSPGTALRISLMTPILFAPISFKITSKVLFSSAGAAAPPPAAGAAATATGAAALTPHLSSSCFTKPAISSTDNPLSCSTILFVSAILFAPVAGLQSFQAIKSDRYLAVQFLFCCSRPHQGVAKIFIQPPLLLVVPLFSPLPEPSPPSVPLPAFLAARLDRK